MGYIVLIIIGVVAFVIYKNKQNKKCRDFAENTVFDATILMLNRIEKMLDTAKTGLGAKLLSEYEDIYSNEHALALAAVIANEIFFDSTHDFQASTFLNSNKKLVASEISRIGEDAETHDFVMRALYTKGVYFLAKKNDADFLNRSIDNLRNYGWSIAGIRETGLDDFEQEALGFLNKYLNKDISGPRNGETIDDAVVIYAGSSLEGIAREYIWLRDKYGEEDKDWFLVQQTLLESQNGKKYDQMKIKLAKGVEKSIYFDISSFYNRN
jgi:hypothetical protein